MISHAEAQALTSARLDGPLDPVAERELLSHLAECGMCRRFAEESQGMASSLRAMPILPGSPTVSRAVLAHIHRQRSPWSRLGDMFSFQAIPAMSALATILVVVALGAFVFFRLDPTGTPLDRDDDDQQLQATLADTTLSLANPTEDPDTVDRAAPTEAAKANEPDAVETESTDEQPADDDTDRTAAPDETEADVAGQSDAATDTPPTEPTDDVDGTTGDAATEGPASNTGPADAPTEDPAASDAEQAIDATETPGDVEAEGAADDGASELRVATDEPTEALEPTATDEPTAEQTESPEPTATDEPTAEPTETPEPTATDEPTAEPTETLQPTATDEPTAEPTETPDPTATDEPTTEPTETLQPTATDEPAVEPTDDSPMILPADGTNAEDADVTPTEESGIAPTPSPDEEATESVDPETPEATATEEPLGFIEPIDQSDDGSEGNGDVTDGEADGTTEPTAEPTLGSDNQIDPIEGSGDEGDEATATIEDPQGGDDSGLGADSLESNSQPYDQQVDGGSGGNRLGSNQGQVFVESDPDAARLTNDEGLSLSTQDLGNGARLVVCDQGGACTQPLTTGSPEDESRISVTDGDDSDDEAGIPDDGFAEDTALGWVGSTIYYVQRGDQGITYRSVTYDGSALVDDQELLAVDDGQVGTVGYVTNDSLIVPGPASWVYLSASGGSRDLGSNPYGSASAVRTNFANGEIVYIAGGQVIVATIDAPGAAVAVIPVSAVDADLSPNGDRVVIANGSSVQVLTLGGEVIASFDSQSGATATSVLWIADGILWLDGNGGAVSLIPADTLP